MTSAKTPILSFLLCSRSDSYTGDESFNRLFWSLNAIDEINDGSFEIVLVDWGSPDTKDEPSLATKLQEYSLWINLRVLYVPQSVTSAFSSPFSEVHALNLASHFATSPWLARIDQDTIVGEGFFDWFLTSSKLSEQKAWFSSRRELPKGVHQVTTNETLRYPRWDACENPDEFWRSAVGTLLVPRKVWHDLRGFDERYIYRNYMECDFAIRLAKHCGLENLGPHTNYSFFHQWHEQEGNKRKQNPMFTTGELLEQCQALGLARNNPKTWGLQQYHSLVKEVVLP